MIEEDQLMGVNPEDFFIDEGFYLEIYCSPDGKYEGDSIDGASWFIYFDKEATLTELLDIFQKEGNILDDTLSISVIPNEAPAYIDARNFSTTISVKQEEHRDANTPPEYKEIIFKHKENSSEIKHRPTNRYTEKYYIEMFEQKYRNDGYTLIKNK